MATVTKPLMLDETGQDILNKLDDILIATPVVDNCSTADPVKALSANQGKILNETTVKFTNEAVGSVTPINAAQLNGHTDEYFAIKSEATTWTHVSITSSSFDNTTGMSVLNSCDCYYNKNLAFFRIDATMTNNTLQRYNISGIPIPLKPVALSSVEWASDTTTSCYAAMTSNDNKARLQLRSNSSSGNRILASGIYIHSLT